MRGEAAMEKLLAEHEFRTVCDIGSGKGEAALRLLAAGKEVTCVDWREPPQEAAAAHWVPGPFESAFGDARQFDAIWCSHVLEHVPNVGRFLGLVSRRLKPGAALAVTVPPMKAQIVGGHVSLWNAGLLLYRMVLTGMDCSGASVRTEGYDVSVVMEHRPFALPELVNDAGDLTALREHFPAGLEWDGDGFDGDIARLNW